VRIGIQGRVIFSAATLAAVGVGAYTAFPAETPGSSASHSTQTGMTSLDEGSAVRVAASSRVGTLAASTSPGSTIPSLPLGVPLPGTPFPSFPAGTPFPNFPLGSPFPSFPAGNPFPSFPLGTPFPSFPGGTSFPTFPLGAGAPFPGFSNQFPFFGGSGGSFVPGTMPGVGVTYKVGKPGAGDKAPPSLTLSVGVTFPVGSLLPLGGPLPGFASSTSPILPDSGLSVDPILGGTGDGCLILFDCFSSHRHLLGDLRLLLGDDDRRGRDLLLGLGDGEHHDLRPRRSHP
jgi:hypothetical protein